jgi:hypothetical protein
MIEEQVKYRIVQHRGISTGWGPEYTDPDESSHKSQPHQSYGNIVASVIWLHGGNLAKLATELGKDSQRKHK